MIPLQLMIGQLTGQPLPHHQIEPTRIHTISEHGNSICYGRSQNEAEADKRRTENSMNKILDNLRQHYGNRMFTRNSIKRESLFPHSKANLVLVLKQMMESGEILLHASDNRGDIYVFATADRPPPYVSPDARQGVLAEKVTHMRQFVPTWGQAATGFTEKALKNAQQDFGIAASLAISQMLDAGEIELVSIRAGRRTYKLKDRA